jgi:hypothetical protein
VNAREFGIDLECVIKEQIVYWMFQSCLLVTVCCHDGWRVGQISLFGASTVNKHNENKLTSISALKRSVAVGSVLLVGAIAERKSAPEESSP